VKNGTEQKCDQNTQPEKPQTNESEITEQKSEDKKSQQDAMCHT